MTPVRLASHTSTGGIIDVTAAVYLEEAHADIAQVAGQLTLDEPEGGAP